MSAYQNFLDFFTMYNRERLDGLNETYFAPMTAEERSKAFDHLLEMTRPGGSDESVKGLFLADAERAVPVVRELLEQGVLNDDAALAAAWELYRRQPDPALIEVFLRLMSSTDRTLRSRAAFYVPADESNEALLEALRGMIRTETETLPLVNATNKLLECYGITEDSLPEAQYLRLYRGLRSDDLKTKEATFKDLDRLFGLDA
ncbi:hypothetical protein G5B88_04760 [Herbaspirillum seropedicae]|jgi:hypothetical protein|uniref:HEAT repeat domain-containing protein n=1 Tax=Herbaspirillum seropedicae (strain SmR1) TaxID=757424 RepID=D8J0Q5_HERSS|nr:hypothetical protein [Herbaspirillum seropedicae]ADJ62460.1 hypothetical protein Hsero_0943 [Herbaspirillum seropedicae SmR1]AKN64586.1 hypothetical protein ACP92_04720 [Herbaspirillum seropedicae]AON53174.1 hypothetical protein Hsc_0870 [Herbaspirillum seropedicae]MDR6398445.1 hypothetical protein [Herbaspirillum seropedicae]NQE30995.1 hypothetical protein [Herbaspirillum seropedicae]